jgi:hypothetical protein
VLAAALSAGIHHVALAELLIVVGVLYPAVALRFVNFELLEVPCTFLKINC